MVDFEKQRWRSRLEARLLSLAAEGRHRTYGDRKTAAIGAMRGTVVEIGPGVGANLRYYAEGVRVIAVEPNPHYHGELRSAAERHGVDLDLRTLRGERLDVEASEADGVVGTLLLCGVDDPVEVLREVRRVLRPGGTYFFLEHVAGVPGSWTRRAQRALRRPHGWMFNGCDPMRETEDLIRSAGFADVDVTAVDEGLAAFHCRPHIVGTAVA